MSDGTAGEVTDGGPAVAPAHSPELVVAPAPDQTTRETVESIIIAVMLAFLFRGFVAEAFVIPTGSMAPTLQGRHMDVACRECGYQYRTGASVENEGVGLPIGEVTQTRCPLCRYTMKLDKQADANEKSFNGDRILVSKFAYQLNEPRRWDVIVFKYPGEAKINYIKRLVGLPGETIRIRHGDVWVQVPSAGPNDASTFRIARKPPEKVLSMLQLVDDSRYLAPRLQAANWPSRWSQQSRVADSEQWRRAPDGFTLAVAAGSSESWMRYRHLIPRSDDWHRMIHQEALPKSEYQGQLITDYYTYNDSYPHLHATDAGGDCWVGDLAVELDVQWQAGDGELLLDLIEGGIHHRCAIDASGIARLSIDRGQKHFGDGEEAKMAEVRGATPLRGPGKHHVRFANVDNQLILWVDDEVVEFDGPTTFVRLDDLTPRWSPQEPGDLAPVGVGARGATLLVERIRILRDVYYRAVEPVDPYKDSEYDRTTVGYGFDVHGVMSDPRSWQTTPLFNARRSVTFRLEQDQFFPLGDNSPQSKDARLWSEIHGDGHVDPPPFVDRSLLIGKALLVYWPHSWRLGSDWFPIVPNFQRMGRIR